MITISTPGISNPRAATSVATSVLIEPDLKSAKVLALSGCEISPCKGAIFPTNFKI